MVPSGSSLRSSSERLNKGIGFPRLTRSPRQSRDAKASKSAGVKSVTTTTDKRQQIITSLASKEYRDAFIAAEIATTIPLQIKALRKAKGWSQKQLAKAVGMPQGRISILENPDYEGAMNVRTLERLASAFDIGLVVRFAPFSEIVDWTSSLTAQNHHIPSFDSDEALRRTFATTEYSTGTLTV